jgi:putative ABC transport system substrate-binding protein
MRRREFIAGLGGAAAAWPMVARGQQQPMPVVGIIDVRSSWYGPFVEGLHEIGFIDHRNVVIDHREASEVDQIPAIAVELVRNKVAVISAATVIGVSPTAVPNRPMSLADVDLTPETGLAGAGE